MKAAIKKADKQDYMVFRLTKKFDHILNPAKDADEKWDEAIKEEKKRVEEHNGNHNAKVEFLKALMAKTKQST